MSVKSNPPTSRQRAESKIALTAAVPMALSVRARWRPSASAAEARLDHRVGPCKQVLHHAGRTPRAGPSPPHGSDPRSDPSSNPNSTATAPEATSDRVGGDAQSIAPGGQTAGAETDAQHEHPEQPAAGPGQCWAAALPPSVWLARSRSPPPPPRTTPAAPSRPPAKPADLPAAGSPGHQQLERRDRLEAGPDTRGSIAWLEAKAQAATAAGDNDLAQLYSDRAVRRTEAVEVLKALGPDLAGSGSSTAADRPPPMARPRPSVRLGG